MGFYRIMKSSNQKYYIIILRNIKPIGIWILLFIILDNKYINQMYKILEKYEYLICIYNAYLS